MSSPQETEQEAVGLDIAIIGMSGRFPGAGNLDEFWNNLRDGVESIAFFSDEELLAAGVTPAELAAPNYVRAAPVLKDIDQFDADFFGYSPLEATTMDPQQRLILECSWQALEHAGYDPERYSEPVGVFAGARMSSYLVGLYTDPQLANPQNMLMVLLGNDISALSTRISYKLNLRGPSAAVQTACSTGLVAVHLACQSLLMGECRMALAAAVTINVPHEIGYLYQEGSMLSPDGHCRSFDAQAGGTVFGSGMGVVVLKRLEDALEDGDTIYAVIKGSAINNDGALKASFTAPSVEGQSGVVIDALASSGIDAETISYVEAHATATTLGDPIEVRALTQAFRAQTSKNGFCQIGTVKSNLGHLDAAAGMAGLFKTVLAMQHQQIPPTLHFERPNPDIDFENSPFRVTTALTPWISQDGPRRAGVSSFGFGGTNAHVILEEAPPLPATDQSRPVQLLLLAARTQTALDQATANLAAHLRAHPDLNLADVAFTLQLGRHAFGRRRMVLCRSVEQAAAALETLDTGAVFTNDREHGERPVVFMFPGQGAQHPNMGRALYETEPTFRAAVDRCCALLRPQLDVDLRDLLYPAAAQTERAAEQLQQTALTQPALFVIEYALAQLWQSWGVQPAALIGHSIGEYVAATLAGVFSLEDALRLVATRGQLMQQLPSGTMLSVPLPAEELRAHLPASCDLAALNAPRLSVVSGPPAAIAELERTLAAQGIECRPLHTSHAFHSRAMDAIVAPFAAEVRRVRLSAPTLPVLSNVTGSWLSAEQATDPQYWAQQLRAPVRFADGLATLLVEPTRILLEVGPGNTLSTFARQAIGKDQDGTTSVIQSLGGAKTSDSDGTPTMQALGQLWLAGGTIDWSGFYAHERRRRLPLPTYPFERQRYWAETKPMSAGAAQPRYALDKQPDLADWFYVPSWKQSRRPDPAQPADVAAERWLVFTDAAGLGDRLVQRLRQDAEVVVTVRPGDQFHKADAHSYTLHPQRQQDYTALLAELRAAEQYPTRIVHLWTVTPDDQTETGRALFERMHQLGFYSLLALAQALGADEQATPLDIGVISNQLHDVTGGERLSPEKATVLGPCRVIPREYLQLTCRNVDLVIPRLEPASADALVETLLAELRTPPAGLSAIIAYRDGRRWTQTVEQTRLDAPAGANPQLRERGVYLITGGLGGIGLTLAEHLARTVQARLVLLSRSSFPAPAQWSAWLEGHPAEDSTSQKIRQLQQVQAFGGQVLVLSADVTDVAQLRGAIEQAQRHFGALHGVIHAAGLPGGGLMQLKTAEMVETVLAPKTYGLLALAEACQGLPLDFIVLCSSLTALVGEFGQSDYAAANALLDAFAHAQAARGGPWTLTINWDNWQDVGMATTTEVPPELQQIHQLILQGGILAAEGVQVFERALAQRTAPQVLVSTKDLPTRIESIHALTRSMLSEAQQQAQALANREGHARPELTTAYVAPRNEFEQHVAGVWQEVLGIAEIGVHDSFFDLGGHSLLITQLINKLQRVYQVDISIQSLFDNPTVAGMAQVIEQGYLEKANSSARPIKELVRGVSAAERQSLLEAYWKKKLATALRIGVEQLPLDGNLDGYDLQAIIAELQWNFQNDLGLQVYPHETPRLRSVSEMARFTGAELDRRERLKTNKYTAPTSPYAQYEGRSQLEQRIKQPPMPPLARKNPPIVFLQSGPRSGSTLFRVMLAGHPQLFSPPEMGVLWYDTVRDWQRSLNDPDYGHGFFWAGQGMQWTFKELLGLDLEQTRAYLSDLAARDVPMHEVYAQIQELVAPRLLVDKSPSYTMSLDTLRRAEQMFDGAKQLHLVRHPYAMIESFVRIRLDKLFGPVIYGSDDVDPFVVAEKVWVTANRNLLTFLQEVDPARHLRVYYEQLVSQPEATMRRVCEFLELPYDPAVIQPYDNKRERMISGIGDPNILTHDRVDAALSETWKKVKLPWRLGEPARQLAAELGYELPAESAPAEAAEPLIDPALLEQGDAATIAGLIDRAKQLSPEEVQALLSQLEQTP